MEDILKVVVTGEVDAGKSTLVGRFLYELGSLSKGVIEEIEETCQRLGSGFEFAYLLDSFEEERKGQLTIDTTQIFCKTRRGRGFIFIDVPGHKELLKNMISGSSYADIAVLVIDVKKSVEEQTRRHAFILKLLGIKQVIVVLNKIDSVNFEEDIFKKVKENVVGFLKKVGIEPKYFIPTSAKEGENLCRQSKKMPWYHGVSLIEALNARFTKKIDGDFRFPIQDIYRLNGGKVAVGEIISGKVKKGEKVKVLPINKECSVTAIKVFHENKSTAKAPQSIGLTLDNMDILKRGQVICKPELPKIQTKILTKIFCVQPLNTKEVLSFKCATQNTSVRIEQINGVWDTVNLEPKSKGESLEKADFAEAVIATDNPVVVEKYNALNTLGRFVLENNQEIYAVGVIL